MKTRLVGSFAAFLASLALLAGCTTQGDNTASGSGQADAPPKAKLTAEPAADAKDVAVNVPVKVAVTDGTLSEVKLTADGKEVEGSIAGDKRTWTNSKPLEYGRTYSYAAKATGSDGKPVELSGSFQTVKPAKVVRATVNPVDDAEVGVGMPISVKFDSAPKDKAEAEKALSVETSPTKVEGSWAWLSATQVDWRPKEFWPAGTKVKVSAKLYGVAYGNGAYGRADVTSEFSIGRNQVVKMHTPSHRMVVERDGKQVASYPASFGKDSDPNLNTPNGTMIVMEKKENERFDNARYGYTNVWKKWAVRFSNHGEFIHENEENRANIGRNNTSHGCANLTEADARKYFDSALVGDPVVVTGSAANMPTTSDVNDWLFSWEKWKSMSAIK